jgi:tetratricopeptide (TPR) repeat protein
VLTDENGKSTLTAGRRMTLRSGESGALLFNGKVQVRAGAYTMKFAAVYNGRAGSVEHRVVARLMPTEAATAKPAGITAQIGDVVVMPPTAVRGAVTLRLDGRVRGDRIIGFTQIGVDQKAKDERSYLFDVVKQEQGPALVSVPGVLDPTPKGRCRTVEATVDARLLPPGDYGMRLTASAGGKAVATQFAPFSLERLPPAERAAATADATAAAPLDAVKFSPQDVLDASVLGPFLDEVAKIAPDSSRAAIEQAKSGQFDEALRLVKAGNPLDPTVPFIRGLSLLAKRQADPAAIAFREAIAASPQLLVGAFYIGASYAVGNNDAKAVNAWQTSLIALGRYPVVYRLLADALIRTGQPERARTLVEQAAKKWPDDETLRARAMRASLEGGRYEQALEYADRIIERQPSDAATLFLAMRSIFQAVMEGKDVRMDELRPRLQRYYELYTAADGPQQALAAEWVSFVNSR